MRLHRLLAAWALCAVAPLAASADPINLTRATGSNTYFNRPGADIATHDAELRECLAMAAKTSQPSNSAGYAAGGLLGAIVVAMVEEAMREAEQENAMNGNVENCMIVRGWRVVRLPDQEYDALVKLDRSAQAAQLKDWVGAATPHGDIVREWGNDAASAATIKFVTGKLLDKSDLSLSVRDRSGDTPAPPAAKPPRMPETARPPQVLRPQDLATVPADKAVIIFELKGAGMHNGDSIRLRRVGADPATPAWVADGQPDAISGFVSYVWNKNGKVFAFAVPPGRWRVDALMGGEFELNFCLGAPSFEVKAGELVYAGSYDLSADDIVANASLVPLKAWLGPHSDLADRIRPASYANGARGQCGGAYIYALEIKGAPYLDGYAWGGAPRPSPMSAPAPPTPAQQATLPSPPTPAGPSASGPTPASPSSTTASPPSS